MCTDTKYRFYTVIFLKFSCTTAFTFDRLSALRTDAIGNHTAWSGRELG
ncbi:hypothetical protein H6H01_23290 [Nostoc calcicola FACHB-3891]|nr:hypothetical protein [Nostoc calcicola FACHB-3891]